MWFANSSSERSASTLCSTTISFGSTEAMTLRYSIGFSDLDYAGSMLAEVSSQSFQKVTLELVT